MRAYKTSNFHHSAKFVIQILFKNKKQQFTPNLSRFVINKNTKEPWEKNFSFIRFKPFN